MRTYLVEPIAASPVGLVLGLVTALVSAALLVCCGDAAVADALIAISRQ